MKQYKNLRNVAVMAMIAITTMFSACAVNAQTAQNKQQAKVEKQREAQQKEREKQQAKREKQREKQQAERQKHQSALSEHEIVIKKEFAVSSSPSLSISNSFGSIQIIEGASDKIVFNIKITGKGQDKDIAKKQAESVEVNFNHSRNSVSAIPEFKQIQCNNCGRHVNFEVTVPKNTKLLLENRHGDIRVNNATGPLDVNLQFGKFYANDLSEANLNIQHGGATINQCENLKIKSSFSKYDLGKIGFLSGSMSHDGFKIDETGSADLKSDFSSTDIGKLKHSIRMNQISHGSLKIAHVDENFSNIKVDANFSTVKIALTEKHHFKAVLYSSFGNIKTGDVVFYEKSLDKKDAVVGIAGKHKEPSATVEISTSHGNIVFE